VVILKRRTSDVRLFALLCIIACDTRSHNVAGETAAESSGGTATAAESEASSGPSSDTSDSTAGQPNCEQHLTQAECEAEDPGCTFVPGGEVELVDAECTSVGMDTGWCFYGTTGGSHSPSGWYETASGRVFVFPIIPVPSLPGWEPCSCEAVEGQPAACECGGLDHCDGAGSTGPGGEESNGSDGSSSTG
jgi:hypothetical protein